MPFPFNRPSAAVIYCESQGPASRLPALDVAHVLVRLNLRTGTMPAMRWEEAPQADHAPPLLDEHGGKLFTVDPRVVARCAACGRFIRIK